MDLHEAWPVLATMAPRQQAAMDRKHARATHGVAELVALAVEDLGRTGDPVDAWGSMTMRVADYLADSGECSSITGFAMALVAAAVVQLAGARPVAVEGLA